jgi:DNA repair exonuclease SbcCD ATPase subunit
MTDLNFYKDSISKADIKMSLLLDKQKNTREDLNGKKERQKGLEKAQVFLQKVAQDTQGQLRYYVKDIVQLALDTCFPGEYEFDLVYEIKRGKTEAKLLFLSGDEEIDPLDASGGGVVDIAAFALRIAQWTLGSTRNTIILDEPFKHLSDDLQPLGAEVLKQLSDKLKIQFIIVTHRKEITGVADKIFEISRRIEGEYKVSEVKEL